MANKKEQKKEKVARPTTPAGRLNARLDLMDRQLAAISKLGNARNRPSLKMVETARTAIQERLDSTFDALAEAVQQERTKGAGRERFAPVVEE